MRAPIVSRWNAYNAKPTLFGWFVGQVMKSTGGKANPKVVNEVLKKALER